MSSRRLGILTLTLVVLVSALVVGASHVSWGTRRYSAELEQTAGLRVGESVLVAGVEVGTVVDQRLEGRHVLVTFTVDDDVRLGSATTAEVKVATLLGTHHLQLEPSGPGSLPDNRIPLERTSVPYNLQDVIDQGTDQLERLDTAGLSQAMSAVTEVLRSSGAEVGPALRNVTRLSRTVAHSSTDFNALLDASREVTDQLVGSSSDLVTLVRTSTQILGDLVERRRTIRGLLHHTRDLASTVSQLVDENEQRFGPVLADLETVLTVLRSRSEDLALAVHRLAVSSRYLANAGGNGPWLEIYIPDSQPDNLYCVQEGC